MADDEQHLDLFRCRREWAKSSVPASDLARSRAASCTPRDLAAGVLGEHVGLSEHGSQSNLLAR
jgi:hypothetical protein